MPLVMKKIYSFSGNYTNEEKDILQQMITTFRLKIGDMDPEKNILNKKQESYSDDRIVGFFNVALSDLNGGFPKTDYKMFEFVNVYTDNLIVDGAIVFALMSEGLLQLKNQVDFSDSGLSIAMFNKTTLYNSWFSFLLQSYLQGKREFKTAIIPLSENSGFVGISTEYSFYGWN